LPQGGSQITDIIKLVREKRLDEVNLWSLIALGSCEVNLAEVLGGGEEDGQSGGEQKRFFIEKIALDSKRMAGAALKRADKLLNAASMGYQSSGYHVISVDASLAERGLFSVSSSFGQVIFEVGLSFDWILNLPFIAGSSIKGAVRSAWRVLHGDDGDEVFGGKQVGSVVFMDAYPVSAGREGYIFYPDVLTPHYSKEGKDVFDETEASPVPVAYLTVAPGTVFRFQIAVKSDRVMDMNKLLKSLLYAFRMGLGAKTAIGYGVFKVESNTIKVKVCGGTGCEHG